MSIAGWVVLFNSCSTCCQFPLVGLHCTLCFGGTDSVLVTVTVPFCLANKFGCSVLLQPVTYSWKITVVQVSMLSLASRNFVYDSGCGLLTRVPSATWHLIHIEKSLLVFRESLSIVYERLIFFIFSIAEIVYRPVSTSSTMPPSKAAGWGCWLRSNSMPRMLSLKQNSLLSSLPSTAAE